MSGDREDVEFKTLDGLTLRGWLFKGPKDGPAVVVNGAFNSPKEIFVGRIAKWFGQHGVTALVYDARTLGSSDGLPRNDLDPAKIAEDNHDAVTFLQDGGWVDPNRIALWGFFYSSGIALEAAAYDKRVAAVIVQGLMPDWGLYSPDEPAILARAVADRANQLRGHPPQYIPLVNEQGEHMMDFRYLAEMTPEQKRNLPAWVHSAKQYAPTFKDRMTVQSLYRHSKWKPIPTFALVSPTPVMMLVPEEDEIVSPEFQKSIFDSFKSEKKTFHIVKGRGHMNFLSIDLDELLVPQLDFLKETMEF